jgi:hypothetical protein
VRQADRDTGLLSEPVDRPLVVGRLKQHLYGPDPGRAKPGFFLIDDPVREGSATAMVDVDERPRPRQMQCPSSVAP